MADLQRKTANLFDYKSTYSAYLQPDGTVSATSTQFNDIRNYFTDDMIGKTITISISIDYVETSRVKVQANINGVATNGNEILSGQTGITTVTITPTSTSDYWRLTYGSGLFNVTASQFMVVEGSTAKPYEPYGWVHSLRKLTTATETIQSGDTIYADGQPITAYTLKGNTVQNGTPTPSNPVEVNGVGEKTANLIFKTIPSANINASGQIVNDASSEFDLFVAKISQDTAYSGNGWVYAFYSTEPSVGSTSYNSTRYAQTPTNVTAPIDGYIVMRANHNTQTAMLNEGATAKPYEPSGYKNPISSDGVTTPIYLGEVETTRNIYKLVLTGNESWYDDALPKGDTYSYRMIAPYIYDVGNVVGYDAICTHFDVGAYYAASVVGVQHSSRNLYFRNTETTLENWKQWLADQYSNGTPVIVWYRLATPTTGIVNEPLMKIGTYADSISNATAIPTTEGANIITVDTTVQPSEFTATWTGWHNAAVKEKSENLFDVDEIGDIYPNPETQTIRTGIVIEGLTPSSTYYFQITNPNAVQIFYARFNGNERLDTSSLNLTSSGTIEMTSTANAIRFWVSTDASWSTISNIMLVEGSTAPSQYEPYWK